MHTAVQAVQQGSWPKQCGMLIAQIWSDDQLKERMLADPAGVLQEYGVEVPYGVEVRVVEDTSDVRYLVLPASPEGDLSEEDLACTVGRDSFSGLSYACGGGCRRCGCGRCGCGCDVAE